MQIFSHLHLISSLCLAATHNQPHWKLCRCVFRCSFFPLFLHSAKKHSIFHHLCCCRAPPFSFFQCRNYELRGCFQVSIRLIFIKRVQFFTHSLWYRVPTKLKRCFLFSRSKLMLNKTMSRILHFYSTLCVHHTGASFLFLSGSENRLWEKVCRESCF